MKTQRGVELRYDFIVRGRKRSELVVLLHGFTFDHRKMQDMIELVYETMPDADVYAPDMPIRRTFATARSDDTVASLLSRLDEFCRERDYRQIWIIGYSCGAVLARKLFLAAWGRAPDVECPPQPRAWAGKITRLNFAAGINTGWMVSGALNWFNSALWRVGELWGETVLRGRPAIFDFRRGAPFLIETRLQWLELMREEGDWQKVVLVQTLGTIDDVVSPESTVDWAIDAVGNEHFYPITLPRTGHLDTMQFEHGPDPVENAIRDERRRISRISLSRDVEQLKVATFSPDDLVDMLELRPDPTVRDVAFVIHGIRDKGFWTQKIALRIRALSRNGGKSPFVTVPGHYGYFAMLPFIFNWERHEKVRWFSDLYVNKKAIYPNARFHFVGHSNGTYLLARALLDCPSMRFGKVVFAGSVVRSDYDWRTLIQSKRIERVMNYVASGDWVVAIFPRGLEPLRRFDLGGAGWAGFQSGTAPAEAVTGLRFVRGSHGAGIQETQWDEISSFVVNGEIPQNWTENPDYTGTQNCLLRTLTWIRSAPLVLGLVVGFVVLAALGLTAFCLGGTALLVAYLLATVLLLRTVLFKV